MLERVGTYAFGQSLVGEFLRIQARTMTTQGQIELSAPMCTSPMTTAAGST